MKIHLTGIGGVGMAGLAFLLKRRGHEVDGCDLKPSPRIRWLESLGIPVAIGHSASHVDGKDLVIVTPAVAKDNPEYVAATRGSSCSSGSRSFSDSSCSSSSRESRCARRGEVLAQLVSSAPDSIAVCGSHGKTTTSTFIAKLLIALGENVEWAIGGETGSFPVAGISNHRIVESSNCRIKTAETSDSDIRQSGDSIISPPVLVVEADESDGTLALYHAKTLVVTNCEYDHPDHFKTKEDYFACYETAKANAGQVLEGSEEVGVGNEEWWREISDHNARLAVRVALSRGHSMESIAAVLPRIAAELPDRRFQKIADGVYTDYGHHPTEIRYSINRGRSLLSTSSTSQTSHTSPTSLRVLFQPHRYSRTVAFKREFAEALMLADEAIICPIYAAFEKPIEGGDSCDLYATMREIERSGEGEHRNCRIFLAKSCEEAWEHARNSMQPGDVTLIQGAGDILEKIIVADSFMSVFTGRADLRVGRDRARSSLTDLNPDHRNKNEELRMKNCGGEVRKVWLGAGTNTVKSDLNLSVDYVKSDSPASHLGTLHPALRTLFPWMAGIPGTLGGWVKMNAGAHGHSISEVIDSVKIDGQWMPAAECGFGYRHSNITGEIQDVRWNEELRVKNEELRTVDFYLSKRRKFPAHTRGSVFKNPPNDFAGRLLEECGCKGLRVGGAYVWEGHANVIVAPPDSATASDFLALVQIMRNRVMLRKGVCLEPEVRFAPDAGR